MCLHASSCTACSLRPGFRRSRIFFEPPLLYRAGLTTVWTDGSGRHSSDPHHRRCGLGYYTDTGERVFCALPGLRQSVYRAELHAIARALEECSPHA
eukprot:4069331-Amphidinium_carterae.1